MDNERLMYYGRAWTNEWFQRKDNKTYSYDNVIIIMSLRTAACNCCVFGHVMLLYTISVIANVILTRATVALCLNDLNLQILYHNGE